MLFLLASGAVAVSISRFASAKVVIFGDTLRSRLSVLGGLWLGTAMCSAKKKHRGEDKKDVREKNRAEERL